MNRLKFVQNLSLRDCCRVPYRTFEVNPVGVAKHTHIELIQNFRKFPLAVSARNDKSNNSLTNSRNMSTSSTNFVSKSFTRIHRYPTSKAEKKFSGIFSQQNLVLSSSGHNFRYQNVRNFSDGASKEIIVYPHLQLTGIWKSVAESTPVEYAQDGLVWLHTTTGLPWWATILLATFSIRAFITLPLALYQHNVLAKYLNLRPELDKMVEDLKLETNFAVYQYKWSETYARAVYNRSLKKQRQKLIERDNCHPMKSIILALVQIPMWITMSTALRNLCFVLPYYNEQARTVYVELTTEGFGWITNLTLADGTFVIPVALGLLNLWIIEMHNLMKTTESTKAQRIVTNIFRVLALCMVPFAAYVPSGLSLYWVTSSALGLAQNLIIVSPSLRRLVGIPPTVVELEQPYSHLYNNLRHKIGLKDAILTENGKTIVNAKRTMKNP